MERTAGVRAPATPARSRPRPRHWPKGCRPPACSVTSTRSPPGWRPSSSTPKPPQRRRRPGARNTAPRRPPARRRWPPRPRTWPPTPPSGRPQATGCATILDEWKTISGLDRKTDDALWKRYSAARETFNRRRGSHFADLDRERAGARQAKEGLCERAEELADSTDWGATGAAFRDLLAEWKAAGRAAKDVDDALWQRFKAAQDTFFSARNAVTRRTRRRVRRQRRGQGGAARRGREARHLRSRRGAGGAARDRRQVGRDRQGAARTGRRAGAAAARRGEEGARRCRSGRSRSGSAGPGRPIPSSRRAIRASGGEGSGGRTDQGCRGGACQRRAVASVGRRGSRGARQEGLGLLRPPSVIAAAIVVEAVQQALLLTFRDLPAAFLLRGELQRGARPHRAGPVEGQHDHGEPRNDQADARARGGVRARSAATTPPAGPRRTPTWIRPARSTPAPIGGSAAPASRSRHRTPAPAK